MLCSTDYTNKIAQSLNKGSKSFATALTKNTLVNHVPLSRPTNKQVQTFPFIIML